MYFKINKVMYGKIILCGEVSLFKQSFKILIHTYTTKQIYCCCLATSPNNENKLQIRLMHLNINKLMSNN